jgi:glycosyltransferase involved in cell wall biosynthesis
MLRAITVVAHRYARPLVRHLRAARRAAPVPLPPPVPAPARVAEQVLPLRPPLRAAPVRLLIGPANFAGQAWAWGRAAERHLPGVSAQSFAYSRADGFAFPSDYFVPVATYRSKAWAAEQERYVLDAFTHVLIEAGRPVLGLTRGSDCERETPVLAAGGLSVAMLAHGSDVRLPSRHVRSSRYSPFADPDWDLVPRLEEQAALRGRILNEHDGLTFASTPDLLDDVPAAQWLPVVVDDVDGWASEARVLERDRPVVVHAPSSTRFKGTELIEPIVADLADRGLITYRRIEGVLNAQMPALLSGADIVLDQFVLGSYGLAACEAMAAGRVVVGHVADRVRDRVRERVDEDPPIVEATVDTLAETLERICAERDWARAVAGDGLSFVRRVHDGRHSAQVIAPFLIPTD